MSDGFDESQLTPTLDHVIGNWLGIQTRLEVLHAVVKHRFILMI